MTSGPTPSAKHSSIPLFIAAICLIGTAFWVIASEGDLPGKPKPADKPVAPDQVLDFTALYSAHCAACHGASGKLGPAPPLDDPLFRALVPKDVVEQVISSGRRGTPMPGFDREHAGTLTAAQIQVLAFQIKGVRYKIVKPQATSVLAANQTKVVEDAAGIAPAWGPVEPAPADAPPYLAANPPPASASKQSEAAEMALFARACADCHGAHGEGAVDTAGAINRPEYLALASDQMLRRIIITGRPDLGMPDYASSEQRSADFKPLNSAAIDQLVALLGRWRRGNSGGQTASSGK